MLECIKLWTRRSGEKPLLRHHDIKQNTRQYTAKLLTLAPELHQSLCHSKYMHTLSHDKAKHPTVQGEKSQQMSVAIQSGKSRGEAHCNCTFG